MGTSILIFVGGLFVGLLVAYVLRNEIKQQLSAVNERYLQQTEINTQLLNEKKDLQLERDQFLNKTYELESSNRFLKDEFMKFHKLQELHQQLQQQHASTVAQYEAAQEKLTLQKQEVEAIGEKFKFEFRNLAQGILDEKTAKFTQINEEKISAILTPLKFELKEFKNKVDETYDKESKERFSLGKEVQRLIEMSQQVSKEANNLTTALKGNNKQQGNWGEMILESILENSGLTKGREFFTQEFIKDAAGNIIKEENGKGLQPDVTVQYPDQRKIIIDSKVSLIAWEQYVAAEDTTVQKDFLKAHIQSLRSHIDGLSKKNYPKYAQALDYVLLFIPIEPAFLEAVKMDVQLWKYAYDKRIMLISPTNLLAVLKIIADLWKVEQQNANAIEIAEKAGLLYDKFVGFFTNFEEIGKKIQGAQQAYDDAFKQLSTGRGNIVTRIEELKKMGANASKSLPDREWIGEIK